MKIAVVVFVLWVSIQAVCWPVLRQITDPFWASTIAGCVSLIFPAVLRGARAARDTARVYFADDGWMPLAARPIKPAVAFLIAMMASFSVNQFMGFLAGMQPHPQGVGIADAFVRNMIFMQVGMSVGAGAAGLFLGARVAIGAVPAMALAGAAMVLAYGFGALCGWLLSFHMDEVKAVYALVEWGNEAAFAVLLGLTAIAGCSVGVWMRPAIAMAVAIQSLARADRRALLELVAREANARRDGCFPVAASCD